MITAVFLVYIIGDLIAIPWAYLFSKQETGIPSPKI